MPHEPSYSQSRVYQTTLLQVKIRACYSVEELKANVGLNFVLICIEVMVVRVRHGKFTITGF